MQAWVGGVGLGEFAGDVILGHLSCDANGCDVIRSGEESGKYVKGREGKGWVGWVGLIFEHTHKLLARYVTLRFWFARVSDSVM